MLAGCAHPSTAVGLHVTRRSLHVTAARLSNLDMDVPPMGDSITDGTILELHKQPGDSVAKDEIIAVIETDKVSVDVRSPAAGVLGAWHAAEGDTVEVGQPLCSISDSGEAPATDDAVQTSAEPEAPAEVAEEAPAGDPVVMQVPAMGDSITEGTVIELHKAVGDTVAVDELIAVIETDKVSVDVRAQFAGTVTEWHAGEGDTVEVGQGLLMIAPGGGGGGAQAAAPAAAPKTGPAASTPAPATPAAPTASSGHVSHSRVPLIRFRHGARDIIDSQMGLGDGAPAAGESMSLLEAALELEARHTGLHEYAAMTSTSPTAADIALPVSYGRPKLSEAEMEAIMSGGAEM